MFGLGVGELFILFLIVVLLFGAKNIPEIVRSLGKAVRSFKREVHEIEDEVRSTTRSLEKSLGDNEKTGIHRESHA